LLTLTSSHINAETPGAIHEGGELGYALSVSFGAAMDNPNLIVTCIVGDGEAETGPTATFVILMSPYMGAMLIMVDKLVAWNQVH
jgi:phosphoketolase